MLSSCSCLSRLIVLINVNQQTPPSYATVSCSQSRSPTWARSQILAFLDHTVGVCSPNFLKLEFGVAPKIGLRIPAYNRINHYIKYKTKSTYRVYASSAFSTNCHKVLHPTRHITGHFESGISRQYAL